MTFITYSSHMFNMRLYPVTSTFSNVGVHTFKIIRYGTVSVFFIRFRYSNGTDTGYFLYYENAAQNVVPYITPYHVIVSRSSGKDG